MRAAGAPASSRVCLFSSIVYAVIKSRGENRARHLALTGRVLRRLSFAGTRALSAVRHSPSAYCPLLTAYCLLPPAYCLLLSAYCLLPTAIKVGRVGVEPTTPRLKVESSS